MERNAFFDLLWDEYIRIAPQAAEIRRLFLRDNPRIVNDHVAFRTFNRPPIDLASLEPLILGLGYLPQGRYEFPAKRLAARSYQADDPAAPKIFISELLTESMSPGCRELISGLCRQVDPALAGTPKLFLAGRTWRMPSWPAYQTLLAESEYAAWLSVMGLRANHFTISVNHLKEPVSLAGVNDLLKQAGFRLNDSGGEIKGTPESLLEQSSTLADRMTIRFDDGELREIPTCYYEFARRWPDVEGRLFQGFITESADRIFESTDSR